MTKGNILVVDDTIANIDVVAEILENSGYDVATALNGDRALKAVSAQPPDLILLDVQMPVMDGFETCQRLKADAATFFIPVIFMTALSDTASKVKGFSLGAVDYISKPFEQMELLVRVKNHIKLSQLRLDLENRVDQRTQELQQTLETLKSTQEELVYREKMSVLGNLVSGIGHEINNPLSFLSGSLRNERDYLKEILYHLSLYQKAYPQPTDEILEDAEEIDLDFVCEDAFLLLERMSEATHRIKQISNSLRTFSRADTEQKVSADVHESIDSTLMLLIYRIKGDRHRPMIQVEKDYGEIPSIQCFPGQLHQVLMNLLANAIDIFDEAAQQSTFAELKENPQKISIRTGLISEQNAVEIYIQDNGKGMSEDVKERIFDRLFTTKEVGKGTGLGLSIAKQIIVEAHDGSLGVQSEPGKGTEFCIRLPISE